MQLKAITHCYLQDGTVQQRVIGIVEPNKLRFAADEIVKIFGKPISGLPVSDNCQNFMIEFDDEDRNYFYSGDYTLNELSF